MTAFELPLTHTEAIVTVRREVTAREGQLRRDTNLTPEQRRQGLAALEQEAVSRLTAVIGEKAATRASCQAMRTLAVLLLVSTASMGCCPSALDAQSPLENVMASPPQPTASARMSPHSTGNTWAEFQNDDVQLVVARLRAADFPADVLREVAGLFVKRQLAARERKLTDFSVGVPYWKKPPERRNGADLRPSIPPE